MTRHDALRCILQYLRTDDVALFTTGMISREAFNIRDRPGNFYMIGSMGLLSSLGLGLALRSPARTIWVIEGDGSALMSLGTFPLIAACRPRNFIHVVLDNEAYESTGGQPTISATTDLAALARAAGYALVRDGRDADALERALQEAITGNALTFILAKEPGRADEELGRVSLKPEELKQRFIQMITPGVRASHNAAVRPADRG